MAARARMQRPAADRRFAAQAAQKMPIDGPRHVMTAIREKACTDGWGRGQMAVDATPRRRLPGDQTTIVAARVALPAKGTERSAAAGTISQRQPSKWRRCSSISRRVMLSMLPSSLSLMPRAKRRRASCGQV
eukprot:UN4183